MRYLKICVLSFFLLLHIFVLTASAHTGRTDSNGGHYDWSTGEYHYHHGYPAHDHFDMDGDGIVDCPYDFDDRTGENSGSSSGSSGGNAGIDAWNEYKRNNPIDSQEGSDKKYYDGYRKGYDEGYSSGYEEGFQSGADEKVPSWMLILSLVILAILFFVNRSLRSNTKQLIKSQEKMEKDLSDKNSALQMLTSEVDAANRAVDDARKEAHKKILAAEIRAEDLEKSSKKAMDEALRKMQLWAYNYKKRCDSLLISQNPKACISDNSIPLVWVNGGSLPSSTSSPIHIPENVTFAIDGYPILGEQTVGKPYGDYTAFIYERGKVYHMEKFCGNGYGEKTVHLFDVIEKRQPCAKCGRRYGVETEVPKWYRDICNIRYNKL